MVFGFILSEPADQSPHEPIGIPDTSQLYFQPVALSGGIQQKDKQGNDSCAQESDNAPKNQAAIFVCGAQAILREIARGFCQRVPIIIVLLYLLNSFNRTE